MKKFETMYRCIGANYRNGYDTAYVGDIHSLQDWLKILFPNKDAAEYFKDFPAAEIVDYILTNCGKRLERMRAK